MDRAETRSRSRDVAVVAGGYVEHALCEDLRGLWEEPPHGHAPPAVNASSDYLLALQSARGEAALEPPEAERGNSTEIYAEMLQLLEEADERDAELARRADKAVPNNNNNRAAAVVNERASQRQQENATKPPQNVVSEASSDVSTNKQRKKKSSKAQQQQQQQRRLAPRPIAPKPQEDDASALKRAPPRRDALASRLDDLRSSGAISDESADEARAVLASADDFILLHLDDALAELESGAGAAKLSLLLEISGSVRDYLAARAPPAQHQSLREEIEAKKVQAVQLRTEQNLDRAIALMREAKHLEHRLDRLAVDDADGTQTAGGVPVPLPTDYFPLTVFEEEEEVVGISEAAAAAAGGGVDDHHSHAQQGHDDDDPLAVFDDADATRPSASEEEVQGPTPPLRL